MSLSDNNNLTLLSEAAVSSCVKHMHRQRLAREKSSPPLSAFPVAPTLSIRNPISPPSDFFASFAFLAASSAFLFSSSSFFVGTYDKIKAIGKTISSSICLTIVYVCCIKYIDVLL